jgi:group I intron endonuclease
MNKIDKKLRFKSGIYMFFNMVSGKRYVGSSVNIYNRIHEHIHNLKNNVSHNAHFQSSWNKYGEDAFMFCVLEFCPEEIRFDREQYYIDCLKPEYNLTLNVVANFGHEVSQETKNKISNTLKEKYASGKIQTYKQEHNWKTTYVYNIIDKTFVAECPYATAALRLIGDRNGGYSETKLYQNKYCLSTTKFFNLNELVNHINKNVLTASSTFGKYIIAESPNGELNYFRTLPLCAECCGASKSTLSKHKDATIKNPYIIKKTGFKFYYSDEYLPVQIDTAVLIEKSSELLSGNIGEDCKVNPEINSEIKESESSYSVEGESK